jgi:hypothetical protein
MGSELERFGRWRAALRQDDVAVEERAVAALTGQQTVLDLARSLGLRRGMRHHRPPVDSRRGWREPESRSRRETAAWQEVEEAEAALEGTRALLRDRLTGIAARWRTVEEGQRTLKQNLVKYNSFVKEKKGKVADEISRRMMEKSRQGERRKTTKR